MKKSNWEMMRTFYACNMTVKLQFKLQLKINLKSNMFSYHAGRHSEK